MALVILAGSVVALLAIFVSNDPSFGVTSSSSPFSDEGFNALNARNLVMLGRFSTDGWNLYLVNLPFSLTLATVFKIFGVGIVQARLAATGMVGLSIICLGLGLRRQFGGWPAVVGAIAFGTSALVLFYGRLVYLEDLVSLGVVVAFAGLAFMGERPARWGVVSGLGLAIAIGTKPSVLFATAGMLVLLTAWSVHDRRPLARWLVATVGVVILAGLAWIVVLWLPNQAQIANDLRIWAPITWPSTIGSLVSRVLGYATANDGAVRRTAPLLLASVVGGLLVARDWRRLTDSQRTLVVAAIGFVIGGLAVLSIASYRPNRYVVPLLPGFAVLVAAGCSTASARLRSRLTLRGHAVLALAVTAVLAAPGVTAYASWVETSSSSLPAIQQRIATLLPAGATVVGPDAPTMAMSSRAITIVPVAGVAENVGDLYVTAGARWFLTNPGAHPYLVTLPAGIWEARREAGCVRWFRSTICLYQVP